MTAAVAGRTPRIRLHALGEYEPGDAPERDEGGVERRWSSLRHDAGPRVTLPVPDGARVPPAALGQQIRRVLEVLDGRRPATHLRGLLPDTAHEAVLTRLRHGQPTQHVLRRLRACYPTDDTVEVAAVISVTANGHHGAIAAAGRFERGGDGWHCVYLRLL